MAVSCGVGHRQGLDLGVAGAMAMVKAGSCSSNLTPSLRTSICRRHGPKKTKKKKERKKEKRNLILVKIIIISLKD